MTVLRNAQLIVILGLLWPNGSATAETLAEAMAAAYLYNPVLEAGRSDVRAIDENVSMAHGAFRPSVSATGDLSWEDVKTDGGEGQPVVGPGGTLTESGINRSASYEVSVTQPVFTGLQNINRLRAAEAGVRGARELLRDTERNVLLQTVTAYAAVIGAQEVLKAQEHNLDRLNSEVRIAKERVELTELTNTDLSQAELRRASASSNVANARAGLIAARASYLNVVGHEASHLLQPQLPPSLPRSLPEAQSIALEENPLIVGALYSEQAARYAVDQIRGQLLPQLSVEASYGETFNSNSSDQSNTLVAGRLTVPIYEGGQVHAAVRQAKHMHLSRIQTIEAVRSLVQQAVSTSWAQYQAAKTRVDLGQQRVRTSVTVLDGVRREEGIGQRDLLDVLNAEQDVVDARVELIAAQQDLTVAAFRVIGDVGRLSAEQLQLGTLAYDPTVHYEEVRRKWFGLDITYSNGSSEHVEANVR